MGRIAIIAGQGALPAALALRVENPLVCNLEGFVPDNVQPDVTFRIERLASFFTALKAAGVGDVIFAGAVHRPKVSPSQLDLGTLRLVPRLMAAMQRGDDGTLREVISLFEEQGFKVRGIADVAPDLIPQAGVLAGRVSSQTKADALRAAEIVTALGAVDVGQGCVVAQGRCLALEALPGTDAMLDGVAALPAHLRPDSAHGSGVFYKAAKPNQDRRIDLPTLGPKTVSAAVRAGLGAVVWQAGSVICLDLGEMTRRANEAGLTLWAR